MDIPKQELEALKAQLEKQLAWVNSKLDTSEKISPEEATRIDIKPVDEELPDDLKFQMESELTKDSIRYSKLGCTALTVFCILIFLFLIWVLPMILY